MCTGPMSAIAEQLPPRINSDPAELLRRGFLRIVSGLALSWKRCATEMPGPDPARSVAVDPQNRDSRRKMAQAQPNRSTSTGRLKVQAQPEHDRLRR